MNNPITTRIDYEIEKRGNASTHDKSPRIIDQNQPNRPPMLKASNSNARNEKLDILEIKGEHSRSLVAIDTKSQ